MSPQQEKQVREMFARAKKGEKVRDMLSEYGMANSQYYQRAGALGLKFKDKTKATTKLKVRKASTMPIEIPLTRSTSSKSLLIVVNTADLSRIIGELWT